MCIKRCGSFELSSCDHAVADQHSKIGGVVEWQPRGYALGDAQLTGGRWQRRGRKLVLASALFTGSLGLLNVGQAGAAPGGSTSGSVSHTDNDTDNAATSSSSNEKSAGDEREAEAARQRIDELRAAAAAQQQAAAAEAAKPVVVERPPLKDPYVENSSIEASVEPMDRFENVFGSWEQANASNATAEAEPQDTLSSAPVFESAPHGGEFVEIPASSNSDLTWGGVDDSSPTVFDDLRGEQSVVANEMFDNHERETGALFGELTTLEIRQAEEVVALEA